MSWGVVIMSEPKEFNPNIAKGSVYEIEVKQISPSKIVLTQDNGQTIVIHWENLEEVAELLFKYAYGGVNE